MDIVLARTESDLPEWADRATLAQFLHDHMKPYQDTVEDIHRALDYAFGENQGKGGFVLLTQKDGKLVGALVMLNTGMKGYVPENILLFVAVHADMRGQGTGGQLIERALSECEGDIKLHVEPDNPAKHLYDRIGFKSDYLEMRLKR